VGRELDVDAVLARSQESKASRMPWLPSSSGKRARRLRELREAAEGIRRRARPIRWIASGRFFIEPGLSRRAILGPFIELSVAQESHLIVADHRRCSRDRRR
jgi:hypothetical protein